MPYKNIELRKLHDKMNKRKKRLGKDKAYYHLSSQIFINMLNEFKQRTILPKHIYEYRKVMEQMLLVHFKQKIIKKYDKTELITQSHNL